MMELSLSPQVRLWVEDAGEGEPVVLLHGHSLDRTVFDALVPRLLAAGYRVVRYDQRGHGRSGSPPQGYRFGDHAADLKAVVEHLGLGPCHLVGLSKGGGIALEATLRSPGLARSLALIGPLVPDYPLSPEFWAFFKAFARAIRQEGVETAVRRLWLPHPLLASAWNNPRCRNHLEAMVLRFPAGEYLAQARDEPDRDWTVTERLARLRVPTLVLRGERDVLDFCQMASFLAARMPQAQLVVVPVSGHLVPLEQPEALAEQLLRFWAEVPGADA